MKFLVHLIAPLLLVVPVAIILAYVATNLNAALNIAAYIP